MVLASEMWGIQGFMRAASNEDGSTAISNSRRPVSGVSASLSTPALAKADSPYAQPWSGTFAWATVDKLHPDPATWLGAAATAGTIPNPDTPLDFVGRNHGKYQLGSVGRRLIAERLGYAQVELPLC